jgi:hypothetical protein
VRARELHRRDADAAGRAVHEHRSAGARARDETARDTPCRGRPPSAAPWANEIRARGGRPGCAGAQTALRAMPDAPTV